MVNVLPLCAAKFHLLSQEPHFTGDEAALRLNPLLGGYQDPPEARNMPTTLPEYSKRPFFITGESYGGVYVPTLAEAILNADLFPIPDNWEILYTKSSRSLEGNSIKQI